MFTSEVLDKLLNAIMEKLPDGTIASCDDDMKTW